MLTGQELKKLRNKQIVIQNSLYVLCVILITLCLIKVNSLKEFSLMTGAICLISLVMSLITRKRGEFIEIIVPAMKPLFEYEREKLGVEYKKLKKRQIVCLVILTVMMFFEGIIFPNNGAIVHGMPVLYYWLPMSLLMFVVLNISSYFHIKKVDKSNLEELKGYANRTMLYGIITGIVLGGLTMMLIIVAVIFREAL
ncbi:MAG: hypothetical protein P4L69_02100 [Desulfosporosinus sp.]|nr:hypothetical protein [Desulfosporosinus sp.]